MTDPARPAKRRRPPSYLKLMGVSVIAGLVIGAATGAIETFGGPATEPLRLTLLLLGLAFVFATSLVWWSRADEAVREAHKWAWWWGGSAGMSLGMVAFVLLALSETQISVPIFVGEGAAGQMASGAILILGLQLAGYAVAWATWWLRRR